MGVQKGLTDQHQWVMSAAAGVFSGTTKFDRDLTVTHLMHAQLHWLDIPNRVSYQIVTMLYWCIHGQAPQYLLDCCICLPFNIISSALTAIGHSRLLL